MRKLILLVIVVYWGGRATTTTRFVSISRRSGFAAATWQRASRTIKGINVGYGYLPL